VLLVVATAGVLIGLLAPPVDAQVDPAAAIASDRGQELVPGPSPFEAPTEGCVVPAMAPLEPRCPSPRFPGDTRGGACTLPVVYLGGTPGPCPKRQGPPSSRVIPLDLSRVSR
jgi:hypothetical protein